MALGISGRRRSALAAIAALTLAACGGTADTAGSGGGAAPTDEPTSSAPSEPGTPSGDGSDVPTATEAGNAEALAFTGVDLDGEPVDAQTFAGGDVVLWRWAPW